jgi:hypothetical protein
MLDSLFPMWERHSIERRPSGQGWRKQMTKRFVVSANVQPAMKRAGIVAEVVDSRHPSDGGPAVVALCFSEADANRTALALNATDAVVTSWNGMGWAAYREDYDLGMPVGTSLKGDGEADAITDLLEAEAMDEEAA